MDATPPLIGRDGLLATVQREIRKGRNVLLTGAAGIGKTALWRASYHALDGGTRALYIAPASPTKAMLVELARQLHEHDQALPDADIPLANKRRGDEDEPTNPATLPWTALKKPVSRMTQPDLRSRSRWRHVTRVGAASHRKRAVTAHAAAMAHFARTSRKFQHNPRGHRIDPENFEAFLESVQWRESLPPQAREEHKRARGAAYAQQAMSRKPPSDRQLSYLRHLGHDGEAPETMADASQLIDRPLKSRR